MTTITTSVYAQQEEGTNNTTIAGTTKAITTTTATNDTAITIGTMTSPSTSSGGLELSSEPIWDEQATITGRTQLNETHSSISFIGNGPMTVPDTRESINMTNNGSGLVSLIPGYTDTVSAYGREHVLSEDDGDTSAITFYEIIRDPTTFEGKGLVVAVFDRNATGMLAPFNGMMVVWTHEEDPSAQAAILRLWEWEAGIPIAL